MHKNSFNRVKIGPFLQKVNNEIKKGIKEVLRKCQTSKNKYFQQ